MKRKILFILCFTIAGAIGVYAQGVDFAARNARWKEFSKNNFEKFNFAKSRLTVARISKLKEDENADDFALLRGVVFGKHGRVFKERSIQEYLEEQPWYKPSKTFSNAVLTPLERLNLALIRITEAEKHPFIEPGDMRIWWTKPIADANLLDYSGAELTILIAEVSRVIQPPMRTANFSRRFRT